MLRIIATAILISLAFVHDAFAQSIPTPSTWKNERESLLTIQSIGADGAIVGTFVNKAEGTYCKDDPYPVAGKITGDDIRFWVAFADRADATKNCFTVTEWMGKVVGGNVLDTNWSLAYPGEHGLTLIGGSDKFDLQP